MPFPLIHTNERESELDYINKFMKAHQTLEKKHIITGSMSELSDREHHTQCENILKLSL